MSDGRAGGTRDRLLDVRPGDRWLVAHADDEPFGCGSTSALPPRGERR